MTLTNWSRTINSKNLFRRRVFVFCINKRTARLSPTLLVACVAMAAAEPAPITVVDLLRTLMATGVEVLYSSELVPSTLEAPISIAGPDPMSRVVQALGAHHLELRSIGPGRFVVARAAPPPAAPVATLPIAGPSKSASTLAEVSVFVSRYAFAGALTGEPIDFEGRKIEETPGAQSDAVRALRTAPGLATNLSSRPYVRGALLDDVLVEFDGIPLADPFHFKSFQSLLSVFDPSSVDRAEVFTGGFPVKYGTRSAGVLDLTPRSLQSGYEVAAGASLLSYNLESVGHAERWPIDWLVTARHSTDHSVLQPIEGESGEPSFSDAIGRVRWQVDPASALTLGWLLQDDQLHLSSGSGEEHATGRSRDVDAWLGWDWTPTGTVQARSSMSVAGSEHDRHGNLNLPSIVNGRLVEERHFASAALRTAWTYTPKGALHWDVGAEFARENAELDFSRREFIGDLAAASFGRTGDATITSDQAPHASTFGLFASVHRHWQALEAEAGLRLDGQDYRGFGVRSQLSPRFNVRYDLTDLWHAYGSWGEFTQAQRVDEYRSEENQTTPNPANRAMHAIAGVAHEGAGAFQWRVEVYYNHWSSISPYFDNGLGAVSLLPELEPDRVRVAPADAEAKGVELSARRSFGGHFNAWGVYTLASVTDDINGEDVPRSWDQKHAVSAGLAWTQARTSASILLGWHSGWPQTPLTVIPATASAPAYLMVGGRNSAQWGGYFSADLRLSQTVPLQYGELSLWLDATNITNRMNECCIDLNSTSRENTVLVTTNKIWSPRVVNVGFLWRVRRPR
jgi:outer membrane receptor protein involved in Fe transport